MKNRFLLIICALCWVIGTGVEGGFAQNAPATGSLKNDAESRSPDPIPSTTAVAPDSGPGLPPRTEANQTNQTPSSADATDRPAAPKEIKPGYVDDWPWIIKQKKLPDAPTPKSPPPDFPWRHADQRVRCEQQLADIREHFLKARFHSIQGDACTCAENAQKFLEAEKTIRSNCPKGYLEQNGYSSRIVRNLRWLQELGTQRCLGVVPEGGKPQAGKPAEAPAVRTP